MRNEPEKQLAFISLLEDIALQEGGRVEDYSGRGMYGKRCVCYLPEEDYYSPFELGLAVADRCEDYGLCISEIPSPSSDSMGHGIVLYWPAVEWPSEKGQPSLEEEEEGSW